MKGYTKTYNIDRIALDNADISFGAKYLYDTLCSYCFGNKDTCFPGQKTLASRLKRSVRTIQRYIKELVDAGFIKVKRVGKTLHNMYTLVSNLGKVMRQKGHEVTRQNSNEKNNKGEEFNNKNCTPTYPRKKKGWCNLPGGYTNQRQYSSEDIRNLERALLGLE